MKNLKNINEFFDTSAFGDSHGDGGGSGIFKITYRPFKDMGKEVGPDADVKRELQGGEFSIGDLVIGIPVDKKDKKVAGMITKKVRDKDNKGYIIHIQVSSKKLKDGEKVMELKPESIEHVDFGNKGHNQIISDFKIPDDMKDKKPAGVYTSSELGIETVGG